MFIVWIMWRVSAWCCKFISTMTLYLIFHLHTMLTSYWLLLFHNRWGKALLGATTYFDNRDLLPLKHLLRLFGQSLQCCPPNYIRDVNVVRQSFIHDNHDASAKIINTRKDINNLNPCAVNQRDDIIKYLHDEDSPPISYHKPPYDLWLFKERMYFHHLNYKPFREYQRMTEDEYRAYAEANSRNKKTIIKGVRGLWIFAALPYARIEENVSYDGFHVLMNVSSYTIRLLFDQRTIDLKTRQFCKNINCHPQVWLRTTTATKQQQQQQQQQQQVNKAHHLDHGY